VSRRRLVPLAVLGVLAGVIVSYVLYTQRLADELRSDAAVFSWVYFQILQAAESPDGLTPEGQLTLLRQLSGLGIPVVTTDATGSPTSVLNLPFEADPSNAEDIERIRTYVDLLDTQNPPLVSDRAGFAVHYGEPAFLRRLKWIPWLQALLLFTVLGIGVWVVRTTYSSERESLWSAMARESAHQMGTPLSSLVGWLELMESGADTTGENVQAKMRDDVSRLEKVSRRFELVGRSPALGPVHIHDVVRRLSRYFEDRLPSLGSRVEIELDLDGPGPTVLGNETLLEWAFENLVKNALDSLAGNAGKIHIMFEGEFHGNARYLVSDDGPGVAPNLRSTLFDVGVTTKESGWGVGLSLARRILVDMHHGNVKLRDSEIGASFSIDIPLAKGDQA
jgi:signal transduction histidine kinase